MDNSSSIYLKMRLKVLVSVILLFWNTLFLIGVKEKIGEESYSTVSCLQNEIMYCKMQLMNLTNNHVIDKEPQLTGDCTFCVALFAIFFVLDKIS